MSTGASFPSCWHKARLIDNQGSCFCLLLSATPGATCRQVGGGTQLRCMSDREVLWFPVPCLECSGALIGRASAQIPLFDDYPAVPWGSQLNHAFRGTVRDQRQLLPLHWCQTRETLFYTQKSAFKHIKKKQSSRLSKTKHFVTRLD